jgi:hypothetical protein
MPPPGKGHVAGPHAVAAEWEWFGKGVEFGGVYPFDCSEVFPVAQRVLEPIVQEHSFGEIVE